MKPLVWPLPSTTKEHATMTRALLPALLTATVCLLSVSET